MNVPLWVWLATIGGMVVVLAIDLAIVDRPWSKTPREKGFTLKQAGSWAAFYIALAVLFGVGVWYFAGAGYAGQYFAGFLTEWSLSVDNLFVFYLIISSFAVPKKYQHEVLLVGIIIALVMRGIFIAIGAQAISAFSEVFYLFGALLIYTAVKIVRDQLKGSEEDEDYTDSFAVRMVKKVWPVTDEYHGPHLTVKKAGRRYVTPMLMVIVAIGMTDLIFAVDSIPAIFGLTQEPYIVLTANMFALMGLRQLYFLLQGLMNRLAYISWGLAAIMVFIGAKMFLHALHENGVHVPEIGIGLSLGVIIGVMLVTLAASFYKSGQDAKKAEAGGAEEAESSASGEVPEEAGRGPHGE